MRLALSGLLPSTSVRAAKSCISGVAPGAYNAAHARSCQQRTRLDMANQACRQRGDLTVLAASVPFPPGFLNESLRTVTGRRNICKREAHRVLCNSFPFCLARHVFHRRSRLGMQSCVREACRKRGRSTRLLLDVFGVSGLRFRVAGVAGQLARG